MIISEVIFIHYNINNEFIDFFLNKLAGNNSVGASLYTFSRLADVIITFVSDKR